MPRRLFAGLLSVLQAVVSNWIAGSWWFHFEIDRVAREI
jgi:hypothetical protein